LPGATFFKCQHSSKPWTLAAINDNPMRQLKFRSGICFLFGLLSVFILSCSDYQQNSYVAQIKKRLPEYDSLTSILISKYSHYSLGNHTTVYPTEGESRGDGFRMFDNSINDFCKQNDIDYIEVQPTAGNKANVTYYLLDNNYQYIYNGYDTSGQEVFENTSVRVVPINKKWSFQYEKPNF
jgi:hypothetical protein